MGAGSSVELLFGAGACKVLDSSAGLSALLGLQGIDMLELRRARGRVALLLACFGAGILAPMTLRAAEPVLGATVLPAWGLTTSLSASNMLILYCLAIMGSSLFGGVLPSLVKLTHTRMQLMISLIGGLMLGVGLLHQLPHAIITATPVAGGFAVDWSVRWAMVGLIAMFFLLRMFHFHHHETFESTDVGASPADADAHDHDRDHRHDHDSAAGGPSLLPVMPVPACGHTHPHGHPQHAAHVVQAAAGSWIGIAFGLSLHTLMDGLALAAHVEADALHHAGEALPLVGLATFFGIFLHKPLDSLSITSLMAAGGWSTTARTVVNFLYALMCPLGALLFHLGLQQFSSGQAWVVSAGLAFSAGVFLCISLSDLLPEVEFHSHDRLRLSVFLVVGVLAAWGLGFLEPAHEHQHDRATGKSSQRHDHVH